MNVARKIGWITSAVFQFARAVVSSISKILPGFRMALLTFHCHVEFILFSSAKASRDSNAKPRELKIPRVLKDLFCLIVDPQVMCDLEDWKTRRFPLSFDEDFHWLTIERFDLEEILGSWDIVSLSFLRPGHRIRCQGLVWSEKDQIRSESKIMPDPTRS